MAEDRERLRAKTSAMGSTPNSKEGVDGAPGTSAAATRTGIDVASVSRALAAASAWDAAGGGRDAAKPDETPAERDQRRKERADRARLNVSMSPGQAQTLSAASRHDERISSGSTADHYRIEADCAMRDYDALEVDAGLMARALKAIAEARPNKQFDPWARGVANDALWNVSERTKGLL